MTKCHHHHHDHGGQRTVIHRRTHVRRPVNSGNGNTTVIIIQNGGGHGGHFSGGGLPRIGPGLFGPGDGYPGSPGFDYGHILPSSTYTNGFGPGFFAGSPGFFLDGGRSFNQGLTGNRSLDGIIGTVGGGAAAHAFGGDFTAGAGGAGIGNIFGDGDPKRSAVIGGLTGAGLDLALNGGFGAIFDGDPNTSADWGSAIRSGLGGALGGGLVNL